MLFEMNSEAGTQRATKMKFPVFSGVRFKQNMIDAMRSGIWRKQGVWMDVVTGTRSL